MTNERQIHIAINVPGKALNSDLKEWLHKLIATTVGIQEIGRIVVRRLSRRQSCPI